MAYLPLFFWIITLSSTGIYGKPLIICQLQNYSQRILTRSPYREYLGEKKRVYREMEVVN